MVVEMKKGLQDDNQSEYIYFSEFTLFIIYYFLVLVLRLRSGREWWMVNGGWWMVDWMVSFLGLSFFEYVT
jgi:hypothetical protein